MPTIKIKPVEYILTCDYASLAVDGKLSLAGVFDRFTTPKLPCAIPQLFVVSRLLLPKGKHSVTFTMMQDDAVLAKSSFEKEVKEELSHHTHIWNITNLKIEEAKPIEIQVLIGGKQVSIKRLAVAQVKRQN